MSFSILCYRVHTQFHCHCVIAQLSLCQAPKISLYADGGDYDDDGDDDDDDDDDNVDDELLIIKMMTTPPGVFRSLSKAALVVRQTLEKKELF